MREKAQKLNGLLITVYLLLILAVLPLYMQDGLVSIGSAKYYFFRDRTLLFVVLISICSVFCFKAYKADKIKLSVLDIAVLSFAAVSFLSFLCSDDKQTALWGFDGWYMGLISQLLFVWIYFAVSRWYDGEEYIWMIAGIAAGVVFLLGILNRMNMDPLGIYEGISNWEWNHNHLLSTIGHYNWHCGYASVTAGISLYYGYAGKGLARALGLLGAFLTFATLVSQGSEAAYPVLLVLMLILLFVSLNNRESLIRFLLVSMLLPAACIFWQLMEQFSPMELNLIEDGSMDGFLFFKGWPVILALCAALYFIELFREKSRKKDYAADGRLKKYAFAAVMIMAVLGVAVLIACQLSDDFWQLLGGSSLLRFSYGWGNSRGGLWYMAFFGWLSGGLKELLAGVGPDCFSNLIYSAFDVDYYVADSGQAGELFANAHNEWLNMLVNEGVLGAVAYASVFVCAFRRIWKYKASKGILLAALLALGGYMINGVFSFQQAVSTPLVFAVLGMAEADIRRGNIS
ncbi:MAG: O-antigen ligase family protein [Lachnospiraceae bacterium]|nr:O-antigen ligase family protein [Lachnospiraceae bacterium]